MSTKEPAKQPTGKASLSADCRTLTIKTMAKRGKRFVENVVTYTVQDIRPDPRVANPAYRLTKEDGMFYDIHADKLGVNCTCPHAAFRGHKNLIACKHLRAAQAVRLLPGR